MDACVRERLFGLVCVSVYATYIFTVTLKFVVFVALFLLLRKERVRRSISYIFCFFIYRFCYYYFHYFFCVLGHNESCSRFSV